MTHTHSMDLDLQPHSPVSTLLLQGEQVQFDIKLIYQIINNIEYEPILEYNPFTNQERIQIF